MKARPVFRRCASGRAAVPTMTTPSVAASKSGISNRKALMPVRIDERKLRNWVMNFGECGDQPKAFCGVIPRAEEVDHVAFIAKARSVLDEHELVTTMFQAAGER